MKRNCNQCGRSYEAQRPTSKYCKPSCRVQHSRNPSVYSPKPDRQAAKSPRAAFEGQDPVGDRSTLGQDQSTSPVSSLVKATRNELEAAGVLETMLGQQALSIATEMSGFGTAGGMAALSKELSRVMAEAMRSAAPLHTDVVDELQARREAKLAAG